jgi:DNA-binding transcriptional MocR family regulator
VRLAFSAASHDKIREGVARLARTVREELAATETVAR